MAIYQGTAKNRFTEATSNGNLSSLLDKTISNFSSLMKSSFQDSFVEDGTVDTFSLQTSDQRYTNLKKPSRRKVISQAPSVTALFKKKQFSSLKSNYDTKYLDEEEKLYLRCIKLLHSRKCDEIAYYESLMGFNSIFDNSGFITIDSLFDDSLESVLSSLTELLGGASGLAQVISSGLSGLGMSGVTDALSSVASSSQIGSVMSNFGFLNDIYRIKRKNDGSKASTYTKWIEEPGAVDLTGIGNGTGTIELNIFSQIRAGNSLSDSSATLTVSDPYQLLLITESDIEIAVRAAASFTGGISGFFESNASSKMAMARVLDEKLNNSRMKRNQPEIVFEFQDGAPVWNTASIVQVFNSDDREILSPFQIISTENISAFINSDFSQEEIGLVNQVQRLMKEYSDTLLLSVDVFSNANINIGKLRNRMRKDFLGKHLIQSMDEVVLFVNSNTSDISPNSPLESAISSEKNALSLSLIEQERMEIAPSIPLPIYMMIRDRKHFRSDGTCVFSGLVNSTGDTYSASSGEFTVDIDCVSNMEYLKLGRFTMRPALNNTFGLVNDPLTPFDLSAKTNGLIDGSNDLVLLPQNKARLPYLYSNVGPNAGFKIKDESGLINDKEEAFVIQHTPGLIYQWKEGILSATPQNPGSELLRGINGSKISGQFGGFSVVNNPFAGMDAANVASILICGMPYNYNTFLQSTLVNSGFSSDSNNTRQFFNYLFDSVGRQGGYNGSFIPAKDSSINRDYAIAAFEVQKTVKGLNSRISSLLSQRAKLSSELLISTQANQTDSIRVKTALIGEIDSQLSELSESVLRAEKILPDSVQVSLEGNDIYIDEESQIQNDIQNSYRIRKKPEDVRYNQDKNYFVVSSKYDTEFSIQAFVAQGIESRFDLYNAEYSRPYEIIERACKALALEFFCDVNGNLVLRPPQYNKIPLSLLTQLFKNNLDSSVPILPSFILDVLSGREQNIRTQLLSNELDIAKQIFGLNQTSIILSGSSGEVSPLLQFAETDIFLNDSLISSAMSSIGSDVFSSADKVSITNNLSVQLDSFNQESALIKVLIKIDAIAGKNTVELEAEDKYTNEVKKLKDDLSGNQGPIYFNSTLDKIASAVSRRQRLLRSLKDIVQRGVQAPQTNGSVPFVASGIAAFSPTLGSTLLSQGDKISSFLNPQAIATASGDFGVSPLIRDLTEDDVNNLEGPRSAERFIITDDKIISSNFRHSPPNFNQITITGQRNFIGGSDGTIANIPDITSVSTDFDSWRQYGFRVGQSVHRPDFVSSNDQCAPFGTLALIRERQQMSKGTVTLVGNEYYKAGDNVFLQYRGMVYYVESVSHSMNLNNGSFETTLSLTYGRALGEFIPTPNDIAGVNMLANTARASKYRSVRSPVSDQATVVNLGTIHFDLDQAKLRTNDALDQQRQFNATPGSIQALIRTSENISALTAAIAKAQTKYSISNGEGKIEIRGYYSSYFSQNVTGSVDPASTAKLLAETTMNEFITMSSSGLLPLDNSSITQTQSIECKIYDLTSEYDEEVRKFLPFPSEEAWINPVRVKVGEEIINSTTNEHWAELPVNAIDIVYVVDRKNRNKK